MNSADINDTKELTEELWKEICKDCFTEELWRVKGQYANTPEYLRRFKDYLILEAENKELKEKIETLKRAECSRFECGDRIE